jgi:shikimate kinase/3-dehydroquinate synthase
MSGPRNLVLVGFMGSGKTTVGKTLSETLALPFADSDAIIAQRAGMSIPEIFALKGEAFFRSLEAAVVQELAQGSGWVIATGGGAVGNPASLQALLTGNYAVWLHAPLACLVERATAEGKRPLLAGGQALQRAESLLMQRSPLYAQAHLVVRADQDVKRICRVIASAWQRAKETERKMERVRVGLGRQSYDITIGSGLLEQLPQMLNMKPGRTLVVSDNHVAQLYGERLLQALQKAGWEPTLHTFVAGEAAKNLQTLEQIYAACAEARLERSSPIFALGGGVVGDVAGFAAATYLRGIPFIQVPTTLLAQVDSSVGGKVAVNLPMGKNLAGAFYQPRAVYADVGLLSSLPLRELRSGLAEVIKHGFIADPALDSFVAEPLEDILSYDAEALTVCVSRSCDIKRGVVEQDEKESGLRESLNFGHTVAHAVEVVSGYGAYTHGEAVAIGMVTAAYLSQPLGLPPAAVDHLIQVLSKAGLPVSAPDLSISDLLAVMRHDKKVRDGQVRFVLSPAVGQVTTGMAVDMAQVRAALERQHGGGG